jgi:DNA-binding beta-propeller fold protein YncE
LVFSADEKFLYASGGNDNWILKYAVSNNKLVLADSIKLGAKWPNRISPAGMALDDATKTLYVVTKDDNSLYILNTGTKVIMRKLSLGQKVIPVCCRQTRPVFIFQYGEEERSWCTTQRRK